MLPGYRSRLAQFCSQNTASLNMCKNVFFKFFGHNPDQLNTVCCRDLFGNEFIVLKNLIARSLQVSSSLYIVNDQRNCGELSGQFRFKTTVPLRPDLAIGYVFSIRFQEKEKFANIW